MTKDMIDALNLLAKGPLSTRIIRTNAGIMRPSISPNTAIALSRLTLAIYDRETGVVKITGVGLNTKWIK